MKNQKQIQVIDLCRNSQTVIGARDGKFYRTNVPQGMEWRLTRGKTFVLMPKDAQLYI